MRTITIVLQHPLSLNVISGPLPHLRLSLCLQASPSSLTPEDKEGKRETGRTPEGNRCLRYLGFIYRERRKEKETEQREKGSRKGKSINRCIFLVLIFKAIIIINSCCFMEIITPPDMTSPSYVESSTLLLNLEPRYMMSFCLGEEDITRLRQTQKLKFSSFTKKKKNRSFAFAYFHFLFEEMSQV